MPRYRVDAPGTHDGVLYDPNGKRPFLDTDKPLSPVPSWVTPVKGETAAQTAARKKKEAKQLRDDKKKAADDRKIQQAAALDGDNPQNEAPKPKATKAGSKVKTL